MNVSFTDEQELLAATVEAIAGRMAPTTSRDLAAPPAGGWEALAGAGLVGIRLPEAAGGGAASATEAMIVVEHLARHLCAVPFLGVLLGADLLATAGAPVDVLTEVARGTLRLPVALDPTLRSVARYGSPGAVVWDAAGADGAIMVDDDGGLRVVAVEGERIEGADLTRELVRLDGEPRSTAIGSVGRPLSNVQWLDWEALALALLAADQLGVMEGSLATAVGYSRDRVQFGTRIGAFQAIQHLCADSYVLTEGVRSATWYAAWAVGRLEPEAALATARTAKAFAAESVVDVAQTAVQVLGGVAITWDTLPHVYLRRGLLARRTLGDELVQIEAIADQRLGSVA